MTQGLLNFAPLFFGIYYHRGRLNQSNFIYFLYCFSSWVLLKHYVAMEPFFFFFKMHLGMEHLKNI